MRPYDPTDPSPFPPSRDYLQHVDLYEVPHVTADGNTQLAVVTFNANEGSEEQAAQAVRGHDAEVQRVTFGGRVVLDSPQYQQTLQRADTVIKRHDRGEMPNIDDPPIFWYQ